MKYKRLYLFPVLVLAVIVAARVAFLITILNELSHFDHNAPYAISLRKSVVNFQAFFWPVAFIAEIIAYTAIRKKIYNKSWVLTHSWSILLAFLVLPLIYVLASSYQQREPEFGLERIGITLTVRIILFWLLIAIGHFFFILTIVKSFKKKEIALNETPGILDEFTG
jgi:hypothetical protein